MAQGFDDFSKRITFEGIQNRVQNINLSILVKIPQPINYHTMRVKWMKTSKFIAIEHRNRPALCVSLFAVYPAAVL
jgi:hypothetical protein